MNAIRLLSLLVVGVAVPALAPALAGQASTIYSEDFEDGLAGWTVIASAGVTAPWHAAAAGDCGALTTMAACNNGPTSCDYATTGGDGSDFLSLQSPPFLLAGAGPWTFEFDYLKSTDAPDVARVWLDLDTGDGIFASVSLSLPNSAGLRHVSIAKSLPSAWWGKHALISFELQTDQVGDTGFGWLIDNVSVKTTGSWFDLELPKAGSNGTPHLVGVGTLAPNSANQLTLTQALPNSIATLVCGLDFVAQPFKGGFLHPEPQILVPLPTDAQGSVQMPFTLPPGLPPGQELYFQFWIQDAGASFGLSASNGVEGLTV